MAKLEDLDNLEAIKEIDKSGMLSVVAETPEMYQKALELLAKTPLALGSEVKQVIVAGMGGSAISGNIVADLFWSKAKVPLSVVRGYTLPAFVNTDTLLIAISYSGNTEEVLAVVKEAAKAGAKIVCLSSGGKLSEIAEREKYPLFLVPTGYQPRAALPFLLVPLYKIIEELNGESGMEEKLQKAIALLRKLKKEYSIDRPLRSNIVKQLAKKISGKLPIVFAAQGTTAAVGLRLKTQFNENSKLTALFNTFPELNHNEIVNLANLKREAHNFTLIFLRDEGDTERIKKRMEITKSLLANQFGGVIELSSRGKIPLERTLALIFLGDYLSVYLAILAGVDPTPVEVIVRLKKELGR